MEKGVVQKTNERWTNEKDRLEKWKNWSFFKKRKKTQIINGLKSFEQTFENDTLKNES